MFPGTHRDALPAVRDHLHHLAPALEILRVHEQKCVQDRLIGIGVAADRDPKRKRELFPRQSAVQDAADLPSRRGQVG